VQNSHQSLLGKEKNIIFFAKLYRLVHCTSGALVLKSKALNITALIITMQGESHIMSIVPGLLSGIDCLMVCATSLVCFISTFNGCPKKKPWKTGACKRHLTNLKQYIFCLLISMAGMNKTQNLEIIAPLESHFFQHTICLIPFKVSTVQARFSPFVHG
jgi:hypothetical protein